MRSIAIILVSILIIGSVCAQKKEASNTDVRVIKSKPHVYIDFEREAKIEPLHEGESGHRIWLRLRNNSKWKILFCSDIVPKEYGQIGITYEIERYDGDGETPGAGSSDSCGYTELKAGRSLNFSVPREHLSNGLKIKIQYRYGWEFDFHGSDNQSEPEHYVSFYSSNIPRE